MIPASCILEVARWSEEFGPKQSGWLIYQLDITHFYQIFSLVFKI